MFSLVVKAGRLQRLSASLRFCIFVANPQRPPHRPQRQRQEGQGQIFGEAAAHVGGVEDVRAVNVGDGGHESGAVIAVGQVAGKDVGGEAGGDQGDDVRSAQGREERQANEMKEDDEVVREVGEVVEDGVAVAVRQVGGPAREKDSGADEAGKLEGAVEMRERVVASGNVAAEVGGDGGQAEEGNEKERPPTAHVAIIPCAACCLSGLTQKPCQVT